MYSLGQSPLPASPSNFWFCICRQPSDSGTARGWIFIVTLQLCNGQEILTAEDRTGRVCALGLWGLGVPWGCISPMAWLLSGVLWGFANSLSLLLGSGGALTAPWQSHGPLGIPLTCILSGPIGSIYDMGNRLLLDYHPHCLLWPGSTCSQVRRQCWHCILCAHSMWSGTTWWHWP
jgi:hypothetical protein